MPTVNMMQQGEHKQEASFRSKAITATWAVMEGKSGRRWKKRRLRRKTEQKEVERIKSEGWKGKIFEDHFLFTSLFRASKKNHGDNVMHVLAVRSSRDLFWWSSVCQFSSRQCAAIELRLAVINRHGRYHDQLLWQRAHPSPLAEGPLHN